MYIRNSDYASTSPARAAHRPIDRFPSLFPFSSWAMCTYGIPLLPSEAKTPGWEGVAAGSASDGREGLKPQLAGGDLPVFPLFARVAVDHGPGFVPGLAHDLAVRSSVGRGLGDEAGAQGVAAVLLRMSQLGPPHQPLDNLADRVLVQGLAHAAVLADTAQQVPVLDRRDGHPVLERQHRAGQLVGSGHDFDFPSLPFLVGLGARNADGVAAAMFAQVFNAQGGQLRAAQAADKAEQQQRLVARRSNRTLERAQDLHDPVERQRLLHGGHRAMGAADPVQGLGDQHLLHLGRGVEASRLVGGIDGAEAPGDGRGLEGLPAFRGIGHLRDI